MNAELVRLTDDNPLKALQRPDGTWSAREVQASGHVHSRWNNWNEAIQRGINLLKTFGLDVSAGQDHIRSTVQMIEIGKGGHREAQDYALTPLGLFAACQQAQLPGLDIWFVFAGMQAAGYGTVSEPVSRGVSTPDESPRTRRPRLFDDRGFPTAAGFEFLVGRGAHVLPTPYGPIYIDSEQVPSDLYKKAVLEAEEGTARARLGLQAHVDVERYIKEAVQRANLALRDSTDRLKGELRQELPLARETAEVITRLGTPATSGDQFEPHRKQGNHEVA